MHLEVKDMLSFKKGEKVITAFGRVGTIIDIPTHERFVVVEFETLSNCNIKESFRPTNIHKYKEEKNNGL